MGWVVNTSREIYSTVTQKATTNLTWQLYQNYKHKCKHFQLHMFGEAPPNDGRVRPKHATFQKMIC